MSIESRGHSQCVAKVAVCSGGVIINHSVPWPTAHTVGLLIEYSSDDMQIISDGQIIATVKTELCVRRYTTHFK